MSAQWSQPTLDTLEHEDFSTEPPHYEHAGASMGGQSVFTCGQCWCLVRDQDQAGHTFWHQKTNVVLRAQV